MATRSKSYPSMALDEALKKTERINENYGLTGLYNRETIASGMGYGSLSGTASRAVAALVQYGLLNRIKDQYELSSLAKQYLIPNEDSDKEQAIQKAALAPILFREIYEKFAGQILPRQFANRLINEFGIQQKAASDVERVFKVTMGRAGILQPSGILSHSRTSGQVDDGVAKSEEKKVEDAQSTSLPTDILSVELPSGLIVSYSQGLAPAFAFGEFGAQLKSLNDAVERYKLENEKKVEGQEEGESKQTP